jgi:DNA modification methylase
MGSRTIHPFPARMAPDIAIDHLTSVASGKSLTVLDPMCGSGTVLSAAAAEGHSARGFDVDPLAVLMSTVATRAIATSAVVDEAERVLANAQSFTTDYPRWADPETTKFAEYWFGKDQRTQLARLAQALDSVDDESVRQVLQVALSRIIVTKAPKASLASDTSHSRPHRTITESEYDVYQGFLSSVGSLTKLLDQRELTGEVIVKHGDARSLDLADSSVDLIITSPPYLNAIDYLRGHKMSLIWLGYSIPELRIIRSNSIGAERALDGAALAQVDEMVKSIEKAVDYPKKLPIATITRYAHDLSLFAGELHRVCKAGAEIVTVIGNSTLRGNYIQNDALVQKAYESAGFTYKNRSERDLPENRRYLPMKTSDQESSMAKRMRTEVVLTVEKR